MWRIFLSSQDFRMGTEESHSISRLNEYEKSVMSHLSWFCRTSNKVHFSLSRTSWNFTICLCFKTALKAVHLRTRKLLEPKPGSISLRIIASAFIFIEEPFKAAIKVGSGSTCCASQAIWARTPDSSSKSAETARISSGASSIEFQKSRSLLTLSASWKAMDTTAIALAEAERPSIVGFVLVELRYWSWMIEWGSANYINVLARDKMCLLNNQDCSWSPKKNKDNRCERVVEY